MTRRVLAVARCRFALVLAGACLAIASLRASAQETPDLFSSPATATALRAGVLATAVAEVEGSRVLEGKFTQQRTLRGLPRPLQSTGDFLLVRALGLQWHTLEPVDDEFVLTRRGIAAGDGDRRRDGRRRGPPLGAATELLFALFSLDLDTLERRFDLYGVGTVEAWQIGMRPRDKATARAVRQAVVKGGQRVDSIALVNGAGDELLIEFRDVRVQTEEPSDEQRALFQ